MAGLKKSMDMSRAYCCNITQISTNDQLLIRITKDLYGKNSPEFKMGRVLVRDYHSLVSVPVVRASAMDGVAVKGERFAEGMPDTSGWKLGEDFCRADTGDDFDDKFDTVIAIEQVHISEEGVLPILPEAKVVQGMNVRPCGSMLREGSLLAKKERQLRSFDLVCLAAGGVTEVEVYSKPKVAFLPTGSELVALGIPLERGKNGEQRCSTGLPLRLANRSVWP